MSNAVTIREAFVQEVEIRTKQFSEALPGHVSVTRFKRVLINAVASNPSLLQADRGSLFMGAMSAAQLGLVTDPQLGEAYLLPFKGKVSMVIGYRGLLKLAYQSGAVESVSAEAVYEKDEFRYTLGDDPKIVHVPYMAGDRGNAVAFYCVVRLKGGGIVREVMSRSDVDRVKGRSPGASSSLSPWNNPHDYIEMARKTVLKKTLKKVPLSTDKEEMIFSEEEDRIVDVTPAPAEEKVVAIEKGKKKSRVEKLLENEVVDSETGEITTVEQTPSGELF